MQSAQFASALSYYHRDQNSAEMHDIHRYLPHFQDEIVVRETASYILSIVNTRLEKKLSSLPRTPGVYFHKSVSGEVIYVGKAAVLRNRVRQYFQDSRGRDNKTMALVAEIEDIDWLETESEIDALFLESEMVKRYMPRYNVLLRDDKSQSFVRIDMKNEWPTVTFTRNPSDDGAEYFGPFYNGYALKKALRYLRPIYPYFVKKLDPKQSKLEQQIGLNPDINDGSAAYKSQLKKLISYIKGNRKNLANEIENDMKRAAKNHEFEIAAKLRNKLRHMQELQRRVMFGDREFLDISKDRALDDLTRILDLDKQPRRIEAYDVSHMSGQNVVASMVVFVNGVSARAEYRKFKMTKQINDDTAQIYETVYRRLSEKNLKKWGAPDLIIIDGGKGQLNAAIKAQLEHRTTFPIISIAKRNEEIIVHAKYSNVTLTMFKKSLPIGVAVMHEGDFIVINLHVGQTNLGTHTKNLRGQTTLSPYTDIVKLMQRIRDESHRFAISYHTSLARKATTRNVLEDIPGIGPATRKKLIKAFGSLRNLEQAQADDIERVIGPSKASIVRKYIKRQVHKHE